MGSVAAWVYVWIGGADLPPFGAEVSANTTDTETARVTASDAAFAVIAYVSALLSVGGALAIWQTRSNKRGTGS